LRLKEAAAEADFNLAMINSFIAENVNVVVEESDLSSLGVLINPELQQSMGSVNVSNGSVSSSDGSENGRNKTLLGLEEALKRGDSLSLSAMSSQNNASSSSVSSLESSSSSLYPCGHCQKEFSSRDQLLDHLQLHTAEDDSDQELLLSSRERNPSVTVHQLATLQFSAF
jgi:hypothetical protein